MTAVICCGWSLPLCQDFTRKYNHDNLGRVQLSHPPSWQRCWVTPGRPLETEVAPQPGDWVFTRQCLSASPYYPDFPSIACCPHPDTSRCAGHDQGPHIPIHPTPVSGAGTSPLPPEPSLCCPGPALHSRVHRLSGPQDMDSPRGVIYGDWASPQHPEKHRSAGDQWGTPCLLLVTGPGLLIEGRSHCPSPQMMRRAT